MQKRYSVSTHTHCAIWVNFPKKMLQDKGFSEHQRVKRICTLCCFEKNRSARLLFTHGLLTLWHDLDLKLLCDLLQRPRHLHRMYAPKDHTCDFLSFLSAGLHDIRGSESSWVLGWTKLLLWRVFDVICDPLWNFRLVKGSYFHNNLEPLNTKWCAFGHFQDWGAFDFLRQLIYRIHNLDLFRMILLLQMLYKSDQILLFFYYEEQVLSSG